jgi:hypothetical protein
VTRRIDPPYDGGPTGEGTFVVTPAVVSISIFPVKSAGGVAVDRVDVEPWGLRGDRRWMVVDERGNKVGVSAHETGLMTITAAPEADGGVTLTAPGRPGLAVAPPAATADKVPVNAYGLGWALSAGATADAWTSRVLGRAARLVWLDAPPRRIVPPDRGGLPGDTVSFADTAPLLLATTASLRQLDAWIAETAAERGEAAPEPLDPRRFRPNVVLDTDEPFAEDDWARVRIGEVWFRFTERCDRCKIPLIDPVTLVSGKEPVRTLARHRREDGQTWFGIRVVPESRGTIAVGDPVTW